MKSFDELRRIYPTFIYKDHQLRFEQDTLFLSWDFEIPGLTAFRPTLRIPLDPGRLAADPLSPTVRRLAFCIGMVELVSYWKVTCSPQVQVLADVLTPAEIDWWKELYFGGLGEFFYRNGIETDAASFMHIAGPAAGAGAADGVRMGAGHVAAGPDPAWRPGSHCIIPVGGGKDSVVTLERLAAGRSEHLVFGINPTPAALDCMRIAGCPPERRVLAGRTLDPELLRLNREGYLNGHTPFSALVAFVALLSAYLTGASAIVLSNEASANQASVPGTAVNHQYSKTSAFEHNFDRYVTEVLGLPIRYFSLLRPFNELCIARDFARYPQYFDVFRSCNAGSKQNVWCGVCAKCLFIAVMLAPFIDAERLRRIFGRDILNDPELGAVLDELTGAVPVKAFECVGTVEEVRFALNRLLRRWHPLGDLAGRPSEMPALAARYLSQCRSGCFPDVALDAEGFPYDLPSAPNPLTAWHADHLLPADYVPLVRDMVRPEAADYLCRRRILILGFGREGRSAFRWLRLHRHQILPRALGIADRNGVELPADFSPSELGDCAFELHTGPDYLSAMAGYDLVLKSPGISLKAYSEGMTPGRLKAFPDTEITGQTDLLLRFGPTRRIAGITGTKGKSTTTSLLLSILQQSGRPAALMGNIGIPVLDCLDALTPDTAVALELSSHQLQFVQGSPQVAVITNFYEEHLDHYRSYAEYVDSKLNVLRFQQPGDTFVLNLDHPDVVSAALPLVCGGVSAVRRVDAVQSRAPLPDLPPAAAARLADLLVYDAAQTGRVVGVPEPNGAPAHVEPLCPNDRNGALRGVHNACDIALASAAALALGCSPEAIAAGVAAYPGLPHRLEYVGTYRGIVFYNDSIATIPQSAQLAVETLERVDTLIVGGLDRGIDYTAFADFLCTSGIRTVIGLPDTGAAVCALLAARGAACERVLAAEMADAVRAAYDRTRPGRICLLSPAASSYNRYRNFEARGDAFKHWVRTLGMD